MKQCVRFVMTSICLALLSCFSINAQELGRSLHFDGIDDYVSGIPIPMTNDGFTFEAWVKWEGTSVNQRIFDFAPNLNGGPNPNTGLLFTPQTSGTTSALCQMGVNGQIHPLFLPEFPQGWTHLAVTLDANKLLSVYYDGVLQATMTMPLTFKQLNADYNFLGLSQLTYQPKFEGYLDDVRIWNEARTSAEINDWKDCELAGSETNLISYFTMNQGIANSTNPNTGAYNPHYFPINNTGHIVTHDAHAHNFAFAGTQSNWSNETGLSSIQNSDNNCIEFDGLTNYDLFTLTNETNFDFAEEYTIEFWYKANQIPGYHLPVVKGNVQGTVLNYYFDIFNSQVFHGNRFYSTVSDYINPPGQVVQEDQWHHIAIVGYKVAYNTLQRELIIDGQLVASRDVSSYSFPLNDHPAVIGSNTDGKMSTIRFWNKRRTVGDIAENMSTIYNSDESGLVAQYVEYQDIQLGLLDSIGGNHGVRSGTPVFVSDPCFVQFKEQPADHNLSQLNVPVTFTAVLNNCTEANYSYQWLKDDVVLPGENGLSLTVPNVSASDLGQYALQVTACGRTFTSRQANLTVTNQGNTLHFDGVDDYVKWNSGISSQNYTIETFVKFDSDPRNQTIITMSGNGSFTDLASHQIVVNEDGFFQHNCYAQGMRSVEHPERILPQQWYHVAAIVSNGELRLEVNGVPARFPSERVQIGTIPAGSSFYLGHAACGYGYFHGEMEELRIWDNEQNTRLDETIDPVAVGLLHYFQFDEGLANSNNSSPAINQLSDNKAGSSVTADLYNFTLDGEKSNWLGCGPFANSVAISSQPQDVQVFAGETISLSVSTSTTTGTESYQWYFNGSPLSDQTGATLTINFATTQNTGQYYCEINRLNSCPQSSDLANVLVKGTGNTLNFDGVDDYIQTERLNIGDVFTLELWIKFSGTVANKNIIQSANVEGPLNDVHIQLYTDENGYFTQHAYADFDGHQTQTSNLMAEPDRWYHVAVQAGEGNSSRIIINDTMRHTSNYTFGGTLSSYDFFYIGARGRTVTSNGIKYLENFEGEMDEVRIWNGARTLQEIRDNARFELLSSHPDLRAYFRFNNGDANGDNTNLNSKSLVDYVSLPNLVFENTEMVGFDFEGPVSNYSDCSPVQRPLIFIEGPGSQRSFFNQDITLKASDLRNNDGLTYQWSKNGVELSGEINQTLDIPNFSTEDVALYEVSVTDACSPQNITTASYNLDSLCFTADLEGKLINYSNSTRYTQDSVAPSIDEGLGGPWCDSDLIYDGTATSFKWHITEPSFAKISLSNLQSDVDMIILGDDCSATNCLASSTNIGLEDEYIELNMPIGTYNILIIQKQEAFSLFQFQLDLELLDSKCSDATDIQCGDILSGTNTGNEKYFNNYCNVESDYLGAEKVYKIDIASPLTITAHLSNMSGDFDLFLLDSICYEVTCLANSLNEGPTAETIQFGAEAGTYYLIIDSKEDIEGTFDLSVNCQPLFTASQGANDAFVDLNWSIDKKRCVPQDTGIIVRLIAAPNDILFEEQFNTAAMVPDVITGNFKHYLGPDQNRMYAFRIFNRLSNQVICDEILAGSTSSFASPEIISISQGTSPDSIQIVWRNHSQLSDIFRIHRDGQLQKIFNEGYTQDSLIVSYVDGHDINDNSSIQSNGSYSYCIETFSTKLNLGYAQVCTTGTTQDINFMATSDAYPDKVVLTWADISDVCTNIKIERNGILLDILSPSVITYDDRSPIAGEEAVYSLTLMRDVNEVMEVEATGSVVANGLISGQVRTEEGDYPIQDVSISLRKDSIVDGENTYVEIATTTTDFEGKYRFEQVAFGLSTDFEVAVSKLGSTFEIESQQLELNQAIPAIDTIDFVQTSQTTIINSTQLVNSFMGQPMEQEDFVDFNWTYSYSAADTIYFKLFREGDVIFDSNDANGAITSFEDLTGVPGLLYTYRLEAYKINTLGDVFTQTFEQDIVFPEITPLVGFNMTTGDAQNPDPRIYFTWGNTPHPSLNFDGYRIFRNDLLIGEVDKSTEQFTFLAIPDSNAYYSIKTFRLTEEASFESAATPTDGTLFRSGPLWTPQLDPFLTSSESQRFIYLEGQFNAQVYENGFYDGILFERKTQGAPDDDYIIIGDFDKSFAAALSQDANSPGFFDKNGIPGQQYDYRISTYIEIDGVIYKNGFVDSRTCPDIDGPTNITTTEEIGHVTFDWDDNSTFTNLYSIRYTNYDGIEIFRRDSTNNTNLESIADLPANSKSYQDFVHNPQFDIFFNQYRDIQYHYAIRGYLDIDTSRYYSPEQIISAKPLTGSTQEPIPTNFMASDDIAGHIKLCWEWLPAKQSEFIVYRDTTPLDTLPFTARAYYDYDAPTRPSVEYAVASYFASNTSEKAYATGSIPTESHLRGRVYNAYDGSGIAGVTIYYKNISSAGYASNTFTAHTTTNAVGEYAFESFPQIPGLKLFVFASGDNVDFNQDELIRAVFDSTLITLNASNAYEVDFIDYNITNEETQSIIEQATIEAVVATPIADEFSVRITWSASDTNYDGVEVYRVNRRLAVIPRGSQYAFVDTTGFAGISYGYGVKTYKDKNGQRVYSELVSDGAVFPSIHPVENLTATGFFNENKMLIAWSHPYDNHDYYRLTRNGEFMALISTGDPLMFYDTSGIPGQNYQYEVIAIKGNLISFPNTIVSRYKGVGEVAELSTFIETSAQACNNVTTSNNNVLISWQYLANSADGFEIYRDGVLIAEIDSNSLAFGDLPNEAGSLARNGNTYFYRDYTGYPGTAHDYHVLAYVERDDVRYTSGIEELFPVETTTFPDIAQVSNLDIGQNNILGTVQLQFNYVGDIVEGFQILRDGTPIDTIREINAGNYIYQDYSGSPDQTYTYAVRAYAVRGNQVFFSAIECEETIAYPIVPVPQNFRASQGDLLNHIEVRWDFPIMSAVDSFYIENLTLNTSVSFANGSRIHKEIINDFDETIYAYRIRAARIFEGNLIYSQWSDEINGWSQKQINGTGSETFDEQCFTHQLGTDVDIDGDWAVAVTRTFDEIAHVYRRENGGWSLFERLKYPSNEIGNEYRSCAISGNRILIGQPDSQFVLLYEFDGVSWQFPRRISENRQDFGWAVDIDGDNIIIGAPQSTQVAPGGAIYIYQIISGNPELQRTIAATVNKWFGGSVAIHGNQAVFTYHSPNGSASNVAFVQNDPSCGTPWSCALTYDGSFAEATASSLYRTSVDLHNNKLIVGFAASNQGPRVKIADLNNGVLSNVNLITAPAGGAFGHSVSIKEIPSPINTATYALISGYNATVNGTPNAGYVSLYSHPSGTYQEIKRIHPESIQSNSGFGHGIDLSMDALMIGEINQGAQDQGNVIIQNLIEAPSLVTATDGISTDNDPTETTIYWEFKGDEDLVNGFNIYRNDEFLNFRNIATLDVVGPGTLGGSWNDNSGNAGEKYVYSVRTTNNITGFESPGTSDEGYNRADGKIQGSVVTELGAIAVPGVTIKAVGIVDNEVYTYETTTFPNGQYTINNVFYDSDPAIATTYQVTAELGDNNILPIGDGITTLNSLNQPVAGIVNFIDFTAYVISGQVIQPLVNCPVEGIKITPVINGVPDQFSQATTDAEGKYSIVINPNEDGLNEIRIRIDNELQADLESVFYNFQATSDTVFTDFSNFPQVTTIDFIDQLTYPISLKVKNTCNDAISQTRWDVRVRTLDGCFDEVYQTNINGDLIADLYPLNYVMSVVGADVSSSQNSRALDYFANFPVTLNLGDIHRDSFNIKPTQDIIDESARQFTYHVQAEIGINGFTDFFCNSPAVVIQQGEPYTLSFEIAELHNSQYCSVQEGKLRINNPASAGELNTIIEYDELTEEFPTYTFTAGVPNQQSPHFWAVTVDYLSLDDVFLGRKTIGVFVEGSIRLPGADILVDPASGNDAVPYPALILRDPPGDGSSSYIAGGQTISYETEVTESFGGSVNVFANMSVELFSTTTGLGSSFTTGGSDDYARTFSNELTVSQTISTSDDENFIGEDADIIVGNGLVTTLGIMQQYRVQNCDEILIENKYSISADAATTTWSYTISQIKDIIQGYRNDSIKLERGELTIDDLPIEKARAKLRSYITNWEQVLVFHSETTKPHYAICATDPPGISSLEKVQIDQWQSKLCPLLGTGSDENFELFDDLVWSDPVMDMYNAANISIRNIANGNNLSGAYTYPANDNIYAILNHPDVVAYTGSFGNPVKNITTGGQIQIEESFENVQSSSRTQQSNFFIDAELSISAGIDKEEEFVLGLFSGAGLGAFAGVFGGKVESVGSFTLEGGITTSFNMERSNSSTSALTNSVETGYTIFDDDAEDAFSIAVIQPVSQNQTAYFEFFGGRSSCPYEEGAVPVDNPLLAFYDPQANATSPTKELNFIPADESGLFYLLVENGTNIPSQPDRDLTISLDPSSNENGAIVVLNGVNLSNTDYQTTLPAKSPDTILLEISRPLNSAFYDFPDLAINVSPACGGDPTMTVYATAKFANPCSPVTLVGPESNWVINDDTTKLTIAMQDYDPSNMSFVDATVQYRRIGAGDQWTDINPQQLELGNFILRDTLAAYNSTFTPAENPKYYFTWNIPLTEGAFPDGEYELRVLMKCNNFTQTISNVISGRIARNGLELFGLPQPADQLWTAGDEISFTFNKNIDCPLLTPSFLNENVIITHNTTGDTLDFDVSCYANKLIFTSTEPMSTYDGQFLTATVSRIPSIVGNISLRHDWTFRVITQKLYWANPDTIKLRLYQNEEVTINELIANNTGIETLSGLEISAQDGTIDSWININSPNASNFSVNPSGQNVEMSITASEDVGKYYETLQIEDISAFGNIPALHLELEVIVRPPNWVVDPSEFDNSMVMSANWRYSTDPETMRSTDLSDLISVWMDGEIRGLASISQSGDFHTAYLTIYGRANEPANQLLEFRIWDADMGREYNAYPTDSIFYAINSIRGTTSNPEMLVVDTLQDLARYIYLNDGWTGFSLFTETENMNVAYKLRSLQHVSNGDIIVTDDKFSIYSDSTSWFNFGPSTLDVIDVNEGYMIYLENGPDTLRVTGATIATADIEDINLQNGWNWIGFPFENDENINQVININTSQSSHDDFIKLDFPLPGEALAFAAYDILNNNWNNGNLTMMESNNLYKIFSGNESGATLSWDPLNNIVPPVSSSLGLLADPNDAATWSSPKLNTDLVMPIIAEVIVNDSVVDDTNDKVAFFEQDTLKGFASIEYIQERDQYALSLLLEKSAGNLDIRYYDASADSIYKATNLLSFDISGVGDIGEPYEIVFTGTPCPDHLMLNAGSAPLNGTYEARMSITIVGPLTVAAENAVILNAPEVSISDFESILGADIEIMQDGCE